VTRVFLADEASPVVTRYKNIGDIDFSVRLLLTCTGSARSRARIMARACDALQPQSLFVDSGAFVLRSAFYKHGKLPSVSEAEEIIRNHLGSCVWLVEHKYPLEAVAELDLPDIYGEDINERWREKYFYPFQEQTGVPVVLAVHGSVKWEAVIENPRLKYLGMSAAMNKKTIAASYGSYEGYVKFMRNIAEICYLAGVKFHGYAVTRSSLLRRVPYYSCDSVTWQQALHFGGAMAFDESSGNLVRVDAGKSLVKNKGAKKLAMNIVKIQSHGSRLRPLDVIGREKIKGRPRADHHAIFHDQARVFSQMETYFTKFWKLKGFDWEQQLEDHGR